MKNERKSERLLRGITVLALLSWGIVTARADALLDRATQEIEFANDDFETFRLDIDVAKAPMKLPNNSALHTGSATIEQVHIVCLQGCSPRLEYNEALDDVPIAAFVLFDGSQDFITLWTTRRGYAIRVYHVERRSIAKDLDEASVTPPQVEAVGYGAVVVTVTNPDLAARLKLSSNAETWRSNGASFQMMPAN